jgi:hypothetical protein
MARLGLFLVALMASDAGALPAGMQVGNQRRAGHLPQPLQGLTP